MVVSVFCRRAWRFTSRATPPLDPLPAPTGRFPRRSRLRRRSEFLAVRNEGSTLQGRYLRITVLRFSDPDARRIGIITSRRVGGAVQRNQVRRRVRELFRASQAGLIHGLWIVVVAKHGSAETAFSELREEWLRLVRRLSIVRGSE